MFALCGLATSAQASNLVQNGSFEQTSLSNSGQISTINVSNWSTNSYSFLVFPGTSSTNIGNGVTLYPPAGKTSIPNSPNGGNFVAADGLYLNTPITQTINNLVTGSAYTLTFYQAASQQQGYSGDYGDNFTVMLGAQTRLSEVMSNPSGGYTAWKLQTLQFTATATQEVLSFLAVGAAQNGASPTGGPAFVLLDGVSLTQTPEPATVWMIGGAMLALSAGVRKFRARKNP